MKPTTGSAKEILVVDDSQELLEWMKLDLESRGFRVLTALNGEECVRQVEAHHPPCVILDVMMPGAPSLVGFLREHEAIRTESTLLLDDAVFCDLEHQHEPLYQILSARQDRNLTRGDDGRLLVYQKAEEVYQVLTSEDFTPVHGEPRIHLDGYTTCQLLTSCTQFKDVNIILFTAGGSGTRNERVQRAYRAGAVDYVLKSEYYTRLFERISAYTQS